jgi:CheY-like chemotaxis protein
MSNTKILAVMSDLFFSVKINDAAKKFGTSVAIVNDQALAIERAKTGPPLIVIDLNCAGVDALGLITELKKDSATNGIPIVAFVSHVQTDLRQRAAGAGCEVVVPRSVFAASVEEIFGRYLAGDPPA